MNDLIYIAGGVAGFVLMLAVLYLSSKAVLMRDKMVNDHYEPAPEGSIRVFMVQAEFKMESEMFVNAVLARNLQRKTGFQPYSKVWDKIDSMVDVKTEVITIEEYNRRLGRDE